MIVRHHNGELLLIRQTDHAELSGQFAANWGNEIFDKLQPYQQTVIAASEHDAGWWTWEVKPTVNPVTKRPYSFQDLPVSEHARLYSEGIGRVAKIDPYSGILVSRFGEYLYQRRYVGGDGEAEDQIRKEFIERQLELQQTLIKVTGKMPEYSLYSSDEYLRTNSNLIRFFDAFSLYFCMSEPEEQAFHSVPTGYGKRDVTIMASASGRKIRLEPYPFSKSGLEVIVQGRVIPDIEYTDTRLREEYFCAEVTSLTYRLEEP